MYDVIIIGGGISGLSTAYRFIESNKKILLIESTDRLGGRIQTETVNNFKLEAGAARICQTHQKTLNLIEDLGLKDKLIKLPNETDIYINGKKTKNKTSKLIKEIFDAYKKKNDYKTKLEEITFFQFCIDMIGFNDANFLKKSFPYDAEFTKMNAQAAIKLFQKDFKDKNDYYILSTGLSSVIDKLESEINYDPNITIQKEESLLEVDYDSNTIITDKDIYQYKNLILSIPYSNLKKINISQDIQYINSVKKIPLLRIYAKYPVNEQNESWFKDIKKTVTDNYIRYIIPIDYKNGLIMISYCDSDVANMWNDLILSSDKNIINRLHKEVENLFGIKPPEPQYTYYYYWSDGLGVWRPGYDSDKIYPQMLQPIDGENIFICGDSYSKKQGWIEGALETTYDVLQKMTLEDISFYRSIETDSTNIDDVLDDTPNDLYNIYDVIQNDNWIVLEINQKKIIYDFTNCFRKHCSKKATLFKLIEANKYYISDGTDPKYKNKPIELFLKYESKKVFDKYIKNKKFVKKVGILI